LGYLYLSVSILANVVWALCYKVAVRRKCNLNSVNLFVQIASALAMVLFWSATSRDYHPRLTIIAIVTGILMTVSVVTFFHHIKSGVLAVSWTVIQLAIVVPVACSILLWREAPTVKQLIGLALVPVAFVCFSSNGNAEKAE
jgi:uncharacterized membrane protein